MRISLSNASNWNHTFELIDSGWVGGWIDGWIYWCSKCDLKIECEQSVIVYIVGSKCYLLI